MRPLRLLGVMCLYGALYGAGASAFAAAATVTEMDFRDVAGELRCPTCTGLSVLDSEATFSVQIKDQVRSQMAAGKSKDEILQFFSERYGPWILRKPPTDGINALVWWFPIGVLILGPMLIWIFIWRRSKTISSGGIRTTEEIIEEMKQAVKARRANEGKAIS